MTLPLISLQQVSLAVGTEKKTILDRVSFEIYPNTVTTIVGPNGGGKSTVLKVLLGLTAPTSGKVVKCRNNLRIAYLPQKLHFDQSIPMNVEQLLQLCPKFNQENYAWLVENLELEKILKTSIHQLSGGERQRAFLARCLMIEPELLVLDEPAQGIDIQRQAYLYRLIQRIKERYSCAVLLVSHDLMLVIKNTDHVICLNQHICCEGQPESIAHNPEFSNIFGHVIAKNIQDAFAVYSHNSAHHHTTTGTHAPHCGCDHGYPCPDKTSNP
ncbi:metal ABC transporter ATP-binding protein [Psittacicella hinzii]|nr:metal ABC transporter ATP-binding protein [Psittacicella hinzii]